MPPVKSLALGKVVSLRRNAQFENIIELRASYITQGLPVLSEDTKKREFIGGLCRHGKLLKQAARTG